MVDRGTYAAYDVGQNREYKCISKSPDAMPGSTETNAGALTLRCDVPHEN